LLHKSASNAVSVSIKRRTSAMGHSAAKNLRALSRRNSWLSFSPNCMTWSLVASGEPENKMSNDVALNFRGARFDGVAARTEVTVGPEALVNGARVTREKLTIRAKHFLRELLQALIEFAPKEFLNGTFRTGSAGGRDSAERTQLVQAHDLHFRVTLRELLAQDGILSRRLAMALNLARKFDQAIDIALKNRNQARAISPALVHEGANRDVPAVIHFAQHVFHGNTHVAEKDLVELTLAGHLAQRANLNAGRLHIDKENGEAFVLGNGWVRSNHELAPISDPTVAGPNLLTVDNIISIVASRFRLQRGEVGTGVGLGKSLAPNFLRAENLGNEALFLGVRAISNDGGSNEAQTKSIGHRRRFKPCHLFPENGLLHQRGAAAAVFLWPCDGGPAPFLKLALPGSQ